MEIPRKIAKVLRTLLIASLCVATTTVCAFGQDIRPTESKPSTAPPSPAIEAPDAPPPPQSQPEKDNATAGQSKSPSSESNADTRIEPTPQSPGVQSPGTQSPNPQSPNPQSPTQGTSVDPAKAPLQPVTTYPEAPTSAQDQPNSQQSAPANPPSPKRAPVIEQPLGAAAAEKVPTTGGAASKPAGFAIAPAKQHQTRSLVLKVGAIAAGAIAAGTIYGLSRGTPSIPPGANAPGAIRK